MRRVAIGLAWWVALAAAPAHAALFGDDEARQAILDLRARVAEQDQRNQTRAAELTRKIEQLEAAQRGQLEFANTVDALRREIAQLRGQVDVLTNELAALQTRNRDLYADLDARLQKVEPSPTTVDGKTVLIEREEQAAYDAALTQFRGGDYKTAAASLKQFVGRYPKSDLTPPALYWLGSAYYQLKDYRTAIVTHQTVVDRYPSSPRAPESLLAIAASHAELNDRMRAQATLTRLVNNYPDSPAAKVAKERLAAMGKR